MGSWVGVPNALASELVRDSEMAGVVVCVGGGRGEPFTDNCVSLVAGGGACIGFRSHSLA